MLNICTIIRELLFQWFQALIDKVNGYIDYKNLQKVCLHFMYRTLL